LEEHIDIRFKIKRVEKAADKVFLLIQVTYRIKYKHPTNHDRHQAILGKISLHATEYKSGESNALLDSLIVFRHASRIARGKTYSRRSDTYSSALQPWLRLR